MGKFCTECGTRLLPVAASAEYKQVTVLFADVVRSMDIAAALDIERLREVMTALMERSADVARRYGGGTVEHAGDGLMVLFGAPVALEDHAFRACLAALAIQEEANGLAAEVQRRDGVTLQVRVGLNSGRVIAGEIGSGTSRYAATGETVGFAHRMESAAPAGAVMLSEATARLVEHAVMLADPEWLDIKGSDAPVRGRRLLSIGTRDGIVGRTEAGLVGRHPEMAALDAMLERAGGRQGGVVNVVGPPGIGKSRLAREAGVLATARGAEVVWGFCESHARDVPFHAVTRLLRASSGVADLDDRAARARVRQQSPDADPHDLLLLDDLLGIADPNVTVPQTEPDVRRRRLTALINDRALARGKPTLFIIEDVHWIDAVSEAMLVDFLAVIPRTASVVLITARPDYQGALLSILGAQTITLAPLGNSDITTLLNELLGTDPSVGGLTAVIAERAAGNPFFAEEMVRELVQRGTLTGEAGDYVCRADVAEVTVPDTVQAAIAARIDRLSIPARRTLHAAAVIGVRFEAELLAALGIDAVFDELLGAELIDQARLNPSVEYTYRHPLIRAVAYESQLNSDRAQWHRRLAAAIGERAPESLEENAALIAEHLESAGDLAASYDWQMRAGAWSTNRDLVAARLSWERACRIADALPDDSELLSMRIAPRTMLCATDWQAREVQDSRSRFAELQDLCAAAGDKISLAIAMTGLATELLYAGRLREAAQLSSEQMAMLEPLDDPTPAMGLAPIAFCNWLGVLQFGEIARWSQTIVDLAAGDPVKGAGYGLGSPLAIGLAWRGAARWWRGLPGWRDDLHDAVAMAQRSNPETHSEAIAWTYGFAVQYGVLRADDPVVRAGEDAVQRALGASNYRALGLAAYALAVGLLNRDDAADRRRGLEWMMRARELWSRKHVKFLLPVTDIWAARETATHGDHDTAIQEMRQAVDDMREGYLFYRVWGTGVLVETLLERGDDGDRAEALELVDWVSNLAADGGSVMLDLILLRLRALMARSDGDEPAYRELVGRYGAMAESLGFDGHVAWAEELTQRRQ
ncbi:ATP-binding protein [Mycolicibacterium tusciae]|uniref:Cyclase n=1 Tax=Mycolicibacterium tusciae TaxID=75922 RepID=A0A1X0JR13_9MYCO|nr:adenylate/guanylate cyclase domain-containing protein [Mycolicibacterium tusciae]ORB65291.1 cyclase [Mycolicibacterium tusciae]